MDYTGGRICRYIFSVIIGWWHMRWLRKIGYALGEVAEEEQQVVEVGEKQDSNSQFKPVN